MAHSDASIREHTRLVMMYNLVPQIEPARGPLRPLTEGLDLGRFAGHIEASARLLPQMILHEEVPDIYLDLSSPGDSGPVRRASVIVAVTPRGDLLLLLDVEVDDSSAASLAETLFATWQDRSAMRVGERPLTGWLTERLQGRGLDGPAGIAFGRNVHQSVFPGAPLARRLLADHTDPATVSPDVVTIVLRGTVDGRSGASLGLRRPETLNNPGQTMAAHGRGVSLIVGWSPPVENAFALAAAGILNAVAAVYRIRQQAFDALSLDQEAVIRSAGDARSHVEQLSRRLNDLQLDLSFSVQAYADTILMPELLIESFHSSLREVSALADGVANTSNIVQRVESVLTTRRVMLETASQQYHERRDKVVAAVIAAGSVLALPPALLLAFFGVNSDDVNPRLSVLDLHKYGVAYALAWLPFILLIVVGLVARRRTRMELSDQPVAGRRRA